MTLTSNIFKRREMMLFIFMAGALFIVGIFQSWNLMLAILNLCLISAIMSLGVNLQWGYAGLFNAGIMGCSAWRSCSDAGIKSTSSWGMANWWYWNSIRFCHLGFNSDIAYLAWLKLRGNIRISYLL